MLDRAKGFLSAIPEAFRGVKDAFMGSQVEKQPQPLQTQLESRTNSFEERKEEEEVKFHLQDKANLGETSFGQPSKKNQDVNRRLSFGKEARAHQQSLLQEKHLQQLSETSGDQKVSDFLNKQNTNTLSNNTSIRINSYMLERSREEAEKNLPKHAKIANKIKFEAEKKQKSERRQGYDPINSLLN